MPRLPEDAERHHGRDEKGDDEARVEQQPDREEYGQTGAEEEVRPDQAHRLLTPADNADQRDLVDDVLRGHRRSPADRGTRCAVPRAEGECESEADDTNA